MVNSVSSKRRTTSSAKRYLIVWASRLVATSPSRRNSPRCWDIVEIRNPSPVARSPTVRSPPNNWHKIISRCGLASAFNISVAADACRAIASASNFILAYIQTIAYIVNSWKWRAFCDNASCKERGSIDAAGTGGQAHGRNHRSWCRVRWDPYGL